MQTQRSPIKIRQMNQTLKTALWRRSSADRGHILPVSNYRNWRPPFKETVIRTWAHERKSLYGQISQKHEWGYVSADAVSCRNWALHNSTYSYLMAWRDNCLCLHCVLKWRKKIHTYSLTSHWDKLKDFTLLICYSDIDMETLPFHSLEFVNYQDQNFRLLHFRSYVNINMIKY